MPLPPGKDAGRLASVSFFPWLRSVLEWKRGLLELDAQVRVLDVDLGQVRQPHRSEASDGRRVVLRSGVVAALRSDDERFEESDSRRDP